MAQGQSRSSSQRTSPPNTYNDLTEVAEHLAQNVSLGGNVYTVNNGSSMGINSWGNNIVTTTAGNMDNHQSMDLMFTDEVHMAKGNIADTLLSTAGIASDQLFGLVTANNAIGYTADLMTIGEDNPLAFLTLNDAGTVLFDPTPHMVVTGSHTITSQTAVGQSEAVYVPATVSSPVRKVSSPLSSKHSSSKGSLLDSGPSSPDYSSHDSGYNNSSHVPKRKKRNFHKRVKSPPESPCRTPTERSPTHTPPNSPLTRSPVHSGPSTPTHSPNRSTNNLRVKDEIKSDEKVPRHKRPAHMRAEVKRRDKIQHGMQVLQDLVPKLRMTKEQGSRDSKANVLQRSGEYIRQLRCETKTRKQELKQLTEDIEKLSTELDSVQESLPKMGFGAPQQQPDLQKLMLDHRTRWLEQNWRYGIFLMLTHTMKEGYPQRMDNVKTFPEFEQELSNWLLQEGSMQPIRASAVKTLRSLSTETSIITNPENLSQELVELIKRKRAEAEKSQKGEQL